MFDHLGWGEIAVIFVVGMFVFGPDRLPHLLADARKMIRELREVARGLKADVRSELGPDFGDLGDLAALRNPRRFVEQQLFAAEPPVAQVSSTPAARDVSALPVELAKLPVGPLAGAPQAQTAAAAANAPVVEAMLSTAATAPTAAPPPAAPGALPPCDNVGG